MKIAYCFSWQARTFDICYPYIKKNLFDCNSQDYDVFCCVEDDKDLYKINILKPKSILKLKSSEVEKIIKKDYWKFLKKWNYKDFLYTYNTNKSPIIYLQQLYKNKKVNDLRIKYEKENNIKYDIIVRIRFDMLPIHEIIINNTKNKIVISNCKVDKSNAINDMFAYWNNENINKYYSMYDNFKELTYKLSIEKNLLYKFLLFIEKLYTNFYFLLIKILSKSNITKWLWNIIWKILNITKYLYLKKYKIKNRIIIENLLYENFKNENIIFENISFIIVKNNYKYNSLIMLSLNNEK